ncbi:MAG TPA: thiamine pyrophosphate-dependent enzyme, partial [Methylocella sp.]|nr:thiamine pyrophosphate-dependent enzyme [Methylocella sp.]
RAPCYRVIETWPGADDMRQLAELIEKAERPIFIAGGSRWNEAAANALQEFALAFGLPLATSYRRASLVDVLHPCYAGDLGLNANPKLVQRVKNSDLVIVIGGRLGEIPSQGYRLFDIPKPRATFVHVHAQAEEFGRLYVPDLAIHASPSPFMTSLRELRVSEARAWRDETRAAHEEYLAFSSTRLPSADVDLAEVMIWLRENTDRETIICNGAGNYASWIHRYFRFRSFGSHVAPTSASMGYGVPAAVAMKRLHRDRTVISINGDGDFLMNGQEFATAVQYGLAIIVIVCDNESYGTIRMHQERSFPGRVIGSDLRNPDFGAYARAFGGFGALVERTADFPQVFERAKASRQPAIIHLKIDPDRITPTLKLTEIRRNALQKS